MGKTAGMDYAVKNEVRYRKTVLAVASGGGHWVQLRRLRPAWRECHVYYVTTTESRRPEIEDEQREGRRVGFYSVVEASRWDKVKLILQSLQIASILLRVRPDVVISTGAAPGFFALRLAKWMGRRTVWVDSIANAEELSLSGARVENCADLWLTQWKHLSCSGDQGKGPDYKGTVI